MIMFLKTLKKLGAIFINVPCFSFSSFSLSIDKGNYSHKINRKLILRYFPLTDRAALELERECCSGTNISRGNVRKAQTKSELCERVKRLTVKKFWVNSAGPALPWFDVTDTTFRVIPSSSVTF